MKKMSPVKKSIITAVCIALCVVLPQAFHAIPNAGSIYCPMHIPVLLCGLICGWQYGAVVGFILPLLRSAIFGMPVMFPAATAMAFELMTYGLVAGLMYGLSRWQCIVALYRSLIVAMIAGRAVWGVVQVIQLGFTGSEFTWAAFMSGAFLNAIPGIVVQLILIPAIMAALNRTGLVPYKKRKKETDSAQNNA